MCQLNNVMYQNGSLIQNLPFRRLVKLKKNIFVINRKWKADTFLTDVKTTMRCHDDYKDYYRMMLRTNEVIRISNLNLSWKTDNSHQTFCNTY